MLYVSVFKNICGKENEKVTKFVNIKSLFFARYIDGCVSQHLFFDGRYGVRGCFRHLCYLNDLLDRIDRGIMIDPTLIHFSFAFCATHVYGNTTDGEGSITHEEKDKFQEIKERLRQILEKQITNFR